MRELYAHRQSFLHQLDARVKIVFTLACIILLNLTPFNAWPAYILFLALSLSLALISRLGIGFLLKRALLALPFILAALPLIFTGPAPRLPLTILPGLDWTYSPAGLERLASIAIRSWLSLQAAILLAATTPFPDLLSGLRQLGAPRIFIAIIGLMWRYLFVISSEASRMIRARSSRSAASHGLQGYRLGGTMLWRARVTGGMAGSLLLRSLERSDRVYAAMLSRGYNGEPLAARAQPLTRQDRWILGLGAALLGLLWLVGLLSGG